MKAIILAGGFGTRLQKLVSDVPKPMADISGTPFLEILVNKLVSNNITDITLSLHYMPEKIIEYFSGDKFNNVNLKFVVEQKPLGTGGAIQYAISSGKFLGDEDILILNGDTFVDFDCKSFIENHINNDALISVLVRKIDSTHRYGKIVVENGKIIEFSSLGDENPGFINAGIYIVNSQVLRNYNFPEVFSFEQDFLAKEIKTLSPNGFQAGEYFIDIGVPEDYLRAQKELMKYA